MSVSSETLMRQASMTAAEYMDAAIEAIDARFGKGFAKTHPDLIGAFMQTAAVDFAAMAIERVLAEVAQAITEPK